MDANRMKSFKKLLELSIANSSNEPSEEVVQCTQELTTEKKNFLEMVLNKMSVDLVQELADSIEILEDEDSNNADKIDAITVICDYVCNMDFANYFLNMGGSEIILKLMQKDDEGVRHAAMQAIAELSQNNPTAQNHFYEKKALDLIIHYLVHENEETVANALYSISALVKNFDLGIEHLIKLDGPKMILECTQRNCDRIIVKSCFLIAMLCSANASIREKLVTLGAFAKVSRQLVYVNDYSAPVECILHALKELSSCNEITGDYTEMIDTLKKIVENNSLLPECEETVEFCRILLSRMCKA